MENNFLSLRGELRRNEPMSRHTTWRVGGAAERAYIPAGIDDLAQFLKTLPQDEPVHLVGLGSNLLVRDGGLRGTVIFSHGALRRLELEASDACVLYAEAGVASPRVARFAANHELSGAEFFAGIPGTVGGALAMNAGCFGAETWGIVQQALMIGRDGSLRRYAASDFDIGYRHAGLNPAAKAGNDPAREEWFAAAWFRLAKGDGTASRRKIKELLSRRIATQPLNQPNAGSVFRNPPGDFAARLIEACGLKGAVVGGAMVSVKHANFIVNTGSATAKDIETLIEKVQDTVERTHGIRLELEVRVVGEEAAA